MCRMADIFKSSQPVFYFITVNGTTLRLISRRQPKLPELVYMPKPDILEISLRC